MRSSGFFDAGAMLNPACCARSGRCRQRFLKKTLDKDANLSDNYFE